MAETPSQMLALGTPAAPFTLPDAEGKTYSLDDARDSDAILVMFICNHCPFVKHIAAELRAIGDDYMPRGVAVFAINSNDANTHPGDSPARMLEEVAARGYAFPYLVDADQRIAKAYQAACTPDFYVFDKSHALVYRGQLDGSRPGNSVPVDGRDLRAALDAVLAGDAVSQQQTPSVGCNIKWTPGNAPDYF